ncbi:MAG TPA: hypothetical protein VKO87_12170 [Gemmatimonadaceae bacterium]|nr:hypothetical protein [Gemmatimonadaceae bacterium]
MSYVVIRLRGPTTRNGGMHHCGAGEEENLVWIKASHAAVLDVRSVLYGSCAFTIEPTQPLAVTASGLNVDYISYSEGRKFHCTYDDRSPAKGLIVTSEGEGPRSRAEELVAALARGDWSEATRFVYLDKNTRARMGIANDAPVNEARPKVVAWFRRLYAAVRPGRVVSVKIDTRVPPRALVSYTHEDLDGFVMRYVNGDWYYVLE